MLKYSSRLIYKTLPSVSSSASISLSAARKASNEREQEYSVPTRDNKGKDLEKTQVKVAIEKPKQRAIFDSQTRDVPINLNFPNPRGRDDWDPETTLKEFVDEAPGVLKTHTKMLAGEIKDTILSADVEHPEIMEDIGHVRHNEARVEYRFNNEEALKLWRTGCDSDYSEGFSKVNWQLSDHETAIFSGNINTSLLKDGKVERAGWASIKLEDKKAFMRKKYFKRWRNFTHLLVKCRGDGRSYKVMLHAPQTIDITWGDSWSFPLHTHGGPYWQYEKIPFSKFFHTVAGRIQDKQIPAFISDVSSVGIVLMDRMDGRFQLELDYIGVWNDWTHTEKFAYETYVIPMFNTHTF
ncbi:unnamed protein product, partial [Mesorhabditis belari]|uniref:NADH:ubiquinone oxidoreductase intermediate-associated protein 30 domain-containing protein n=1 Tax=Mesorhabditis belari TaxID=2138241 RepID=A0AAF3EL56_9BILA